MIHHTTNVAIDTASLSTTRDSGQRKDSYTAGSSEQALQETFRALLSLVGKKTLPIPPELVVEHVIEVCAGVDWPVQQAAIEALLQRLSSARRDKLVVINQPRGIFGKYETRRKGDSKRPYQTEILGVSPLAGSCGCPDFQVNSLGLCKHLLTVLLHVYGRQALSTRSRRQAQSTSPKSSLRWYPIRPATGLGDILEQVRWHGSFLDQALPQNLKRLITRHFTASAKDGATISSLHLDDPKRRLALINDLCQILQLSSSTDSALPVILEQARSRAERELELTKISGDLEKQLGALKIKLFSYQLQGVRKFFETGRLCLADDMGLGKTAQAIAIAHLLFRSRKARRGLVIVPASLKPQWLREFQLFADLPVEIVDGPGSSREEIYRRAKEGFLITNYELALRDMNLLREWDPDFIVLDEAQRIKNWATKTALGIKQLQPRYRLVLTGTPLENRLGELHSIFQWIDPQALEPHWRLAPWHSVFADGRTETVGLRNLDTLRRRIAPHFLRRTRNEVLGELPDRVDTIVPTSVTEAQRDEHDVFYQPISRLLRIRKSRPLRQEEFLRLMSFLTSQRIISNGLEQWNFASNWTQLSKVTQPTEQFLQQLSSPKLVEFREIIRQLVIEQGRKAVVFSQWRRMLQLAEWSIRGPLADAGKRAVFFTGQESQNRRTHNIVDFHDDPTTAVLFASDAGGTGLNLQRAATCCINLELPWNPAVLEQRIARIHRHGQSKPVNVYNLVASYGIETWISTLVENKRKGFQALFEGSSDSVCFENSQSFLTRIAEFAAPIIDNIDTAEIDHNPEEEELEEQRFSDYDETILEDSAAVSEMSAAHESVAIFPEPHTPVGNTPESGDAIVGQMFAQLQVTKDENGFVHIKAPPEAAATLSQVFLQMAQLMTQLTSNKQ